MRRTISTLAGIVLALLSLGVVMLFSTSSVEGTASFSDPYYFLKRQLAWLFLSLLCGSVVIRVDYHTWVKYSPYIAVGSLILLGLVFAPGFGMKVGGSSRWIRLGPFSFQPSEPAKFALIVTMVAWVSRAGRRMSNFKEGLLIPLTGLGILLLLVMLEPDFGTTMLMGLVGMCILFAGGTQIGYLLITGLLGLSAFFLAVLHNPVRRARVLAFLMPQKYPDTAYHLAQSKIAFIKGGFPGVGLGNSIQKQFYLPEAHTDFIFAIIGEELGVIATAGIVLLFLGLLVCGMIIAYRAPDSAGKLLAFGLTIAITLQAAINMGVVTGCLPTKGLPLPFISYGGSSLLMSVVGVCVLINIAWQSAGDQVDSRTKPIKDKWHRL